MNINQLETVVWLSRLGNFGRVARKLGTSQPAISFRIRELEKELGVQLFSRGTRKSQLTNAGRQLIEYAEGITDLAAKLMQHAAAERPVSMEDQVQVDRSRPVVAPVPTQVLATRPGQ